LLAEFEEEKKGRVGLENKMPFHHDDRTGIFSSKSVLVVLFFFD